jgi:hypothetical protein
MPSFVSPSVRILAPNVDSREGGRSVEFATGVAAVADRQQGGREERGLALAAVRVAGEDPAAAVVQERRIDGVGIVAQRERRFLPVDVGNDGLGFEVRAPEVVDPDQLQAGDHLLLVAQEADAQRRQTPRQRVRDVPSRPAHAVVMVAENRETPQRAGLKMFEDARDVVHFFGPVAGHEIAGDDRQIRTEGRDAFQARDEVITVDRSSDVQITDLYKPPIVKARGQAGDRQIPLDDLDPVRFDPPRVETRPTDAQSQARQKPAARDPTASSLRWSGIDGRTADCDSWGREALGFPRSQRRDSKKVADRSAREAGALPIDSRQPVDSRQPAEVRSMREAVHFACQTNVRPLKSRIDKRLFHPVRHNQQTTAPFRRSRFRETLG